MTNNAENQAAYKKKMREAGFRQKTIWSLESDWDAITYVRARLAEHEEIPEWVDDALVRLAADLLGKNKRGRKPRQ